MSKMRLNQQPITGTVKWVIFVRLNQQPIKILRDHTKQKKIFKVLPLLVPW